MIQDKNKRGEKKWREGKITNFKLVDEYCLKNKNSFCFSHGKYINLISLLLKF